MDSENVQIIVRNCQKFATDLYKTCGEEKHDNFTISPFGAYLLSAVAAYGASDATQKELKSVLGLPDAENFQDFRTLLDSLNNAEDVKLSIANKVVLYDCKPINETFNENLNKHFDVECEFLDCPITDENVEKINNWCKDKSDNNGVEIISKDDFMSMSILLLSTVYFKGDWENQFLHDLTTDLPFHVDKNNQKELPMMFMSRSHSRYGKLEDVDAKFVELPYKSSNFKMVFIVPNEIDGLSKLENNIDQLTYDRLDQSAKLSYVDLRLPRFKIENVISLEKPLAKMGMTKAFGNLADFGNLTGEAIQLHKFIQKAVIVVDEGGPYRELEFKDYLKNCKYVKTETVTADRPFLTMLVYKNLPLFYSRFTG